jgi:uncharacterized protein
MSAPAGGQKIPDHILEKLEKLKDSMSPDPFLKLVELVGGLAREGLLDSTTLVGDSCDGGQVYWPQYKLYCYSIVADADSDEIRELDGGYIVVQVGQSGEVTKGGVCLGLEDALRSLKIETTNSFPCRTKKGERKMSSAADAKRFIGPQELHDLSEDLAHQVARSGFEPTFMIALWRGGCQTGAVVQEFLERARQITIDHVAVRTVSRDPVTGQALPETQVHAAGHASHVLQADSRLLIVDDVYDSGRSIVAVLKYLQDTLGEARMPKDVRVATVFYKPKRNKFLPRVPEYYVEATDEWLVFPHELAELTDEEVAKFRPRAAAKLADLKK